jgi:hypothetical protein
MPVIAFVGVTGIKHAVLPFLIIYFRASALAPHLLALHLPLFVPAEVALTSQDAGSS